MSVRLGDPCCKGERHLGKSLKNWVGKNIPGRQAHCTDPEVSIVQRTLREETREDERRSDPGVLTGLGENFGPS